MEDILTPICEGMQVNLIVGIGELTKTSVDRLFDRIGEYNKPCRILYISDFDPVGQQMPVSIARKIEFNHRTQSAKRHIILYPIVLTADQCEHFKLPRIPIENKKGKKPYQTRIDKFEEHHGEGGTELDALEAIRPGELKKIVTAAIEKYRDENVATRHKKINEAYHRRLNRIQTEVFSGFGHRVDPLLQEYNEMIRRFQDEFDVIKAQIDDLKDEIREELEDRMPDFSGYVPPDQAEARTGDPLYDSDRDYMDQLNTYKRFQNKPEIGNGSDIETPRHTDSSSLERRHRTGNEKAEKYPAKYGNLENASITQIKSDHGHAAPGEAETIDPESAGAKWSVILCPWVKTSCVGSACNICDRSKCCCIILACRALIAMAEQQGKADQVDNVNLKPKRKRNDNEHI